MFGVFGVGGCGAFPGGGGVITIKLFGSLSLRFCLAGFIRVC